MEWQGTHPSCTAPKAVIITVVVRNRNGLQPDGFFPELRVVQVDFASAVAHKVRLGEAAAQCILCLLGRVVMDDRV